jgi:hypothetical protein
MSWMIAELADTISSPGGQKCGEVHIPEDALARTRYEREKSVSLSRSV